MKLLLPIKRLAEKYLIKFTGSNWGVATQNNPPALEAAVFTSLIMVRVAVNICGSLDTVQFYFGDTMIRS